MSQEIKNTIEPDDIEWLMPWKSEYKREDREDEMEFESGMALAHLLMNEVIFINSYWFEETWPEEARKRIGLFVNCNDIFAWGCSDGEDLPYSEIENLYRAWKKDPMWGSAVWCMIQRNQMPQKPVEDSIRKAGIWDLDSLGLGKNTMDAEVAEMFRQYIANKNSGDE